MCGLRGVSCAGALAAGQEILGHPFLLIPWYSKVSVPTHTDQPCAAPVPLQWIQFGYVASARMW